jgi:hypothetical protein
LCSEHILVSLDDFDLSLLCRPVRIVDPLHTDYALQNGNS